MREENTPTSFPVITIGNLDRIDEYDYREQCVERLPERADNTKTNIADVEVALCPIVEVAGRGAAVFRNIVPGTAPEHCSSLS